MWLVVEKELRKVGIDVSGVQAANKYARVRREYCNRFKAINCSGLDPSHLRNWMFYADLEPSFRSTKQVNPDAEDCSEPLPVPMLINLEEADVEEQPTETLRFPRKRTPATLGPS